MSVTAVVKGVQMGVQVAISIAELVTALRRLQEDADRTDEGRAA